MKAAPPWLFPTLLLALGCGGSGDDPGPAPEALPQKPGCRAHLTGTLKKLPVTLPSPIVSREGAAPLTGVWSEEARTHVYIPGPPIDVQCGAPLTVVTFPPLVGTGWLSNRIQVDAPPDPGGEGGGLVFLWPEAVDPAEPSAGPSFQLETDVGFDATLLATDGVDDICKSSQTRFPVGNISLTATAAAPSVGYEALDSGTWYRWSPVDWKVAAAPFELEDAAVILVCDSKWSFVGGYQLTYEREVEGVVEARAQHDFWFDGELALVNDDQVLGYYRVYDIAVETSGGVTGAYSGLTELLIPVEGFYEKDVDGKQYLELPLFQGSGVTWSFTLDVLGTRISESNPHILQDHFERLNLSLPPSPERPGYFRVPVVGQEDTVSFSTGEGFVIANWGLYRLYKP